MRTLTAFIVMGFVLILSGVSWAELVLIEDFEQRTPGSIDMQGETTDYGYPIEVWNAQDGTDSRRDSLSANVVEDGVPVYWMSPADCEPPMYVSGPGMGLALENRRTSGVIGNVYATMALGDEYTIDDTGTIYMIFKADGPNDTLLALNGLLPGYESDVYGASIEVAGLYQGLHNYFNQATLLELSADEGFRFYDGSIHGYCIQPVNIMTNDWYELWINVDCTAQASRFYLRPAGSSSDPELIRNAGGLEWIPWRDTTQSVVSNIKWFAGFNNGVATKVVIDNIAVDTQGYSEKSFWPEEPWPFPHIGLDEFIRLKQHYGMGPNMTWAEGDYNGDGWVNLDDFIILKQHYGQTSY